MRKEEILTLARSQIGVREDPMGSNRVKYNTEYYGMEVRGRQYPWCCVFQWWLFHAPGGRPPPARRCTAFTKRGGRG